MSHVCLAKWWRSFFSAFRIMATATVLLLFLLAAPCSGQQFETDKLLSADGEAYDNFGISLSLSGDRALVGASNDDDKGFSSGSAYLFHYDSASGTWIEEAKLLASDGAGEHFFGCSVALSGDRALIGAYGDDDHGWRSGSVYVFGYDDAHDIWREEAKLTASDGTLGDHFGRSISLFGERVLIGADYDNDNGNNSGSAYVFHYDSLSGLWIEEAKLLPSDGTSTDFFGCSVSLSGTRALIGAWQQEHHGHCPGAAYLFGYDSVSGTWLEEAKLLDPSGEHHDYFGYSVALDGEVALIGARRDDDYGNSSGSAYLFRYHGDRGTWTEETKLHASDAAWGDEFGYAVALDGNSALVGARYGDSYLPATGSAYLFGYDTVSGRWLEEANLITSDGRNNDRFGTAVALDSGGALVGAFDETNENGPEAGSVYAYDFISVLALDAKCNGQDENVIVSSGDSVTLTIEIDNGFHPDLQGDLWVVAVLPTSGWNTWTYGPWENPIWRSGWGNEYFSGPPANHAATVCDQPLPPGTYKLYLALDAIPNGVLDLLALWEIDVVDFTVQ